MTHQQTQEAYLLAVRQLAEHYYFPFLKNERQASRSTIHILNGLVVGDRDIKDIYAIVNVLDSEKESPA